jgi:hypothetical protein
LVQSEQLHEATHDGGFGASILTAPQWQLPVAPMALLRSRISMEIVRSHVSP